MPLSSISKKTNIIPENMHVNQFSTAYNEPSKILSNMESVNNTSGSFSIAKIVDNVKHLPYPKIKQYLDVISNVSKNCGKHESLPTLNFHGTVKLHGTNGGVAYDYSTEKFWAQSRNQLLLEGTPDNQGFATYIYKDTLRPVLENIFNGIDKHRNDGEFRAVVYGEWCGKGIQKNVAISELPRNFFVFNIALFDGDNKCRWLNPADMHEIIVEARGGSGQKTHPFLA